MKPGYFVSKDYFDNPSGDNWAVMFGDPNGTASSVARVVPDKKTADMFAASLELLEACRAVVLWAETPGNHGGNPHRHQFMDKIKSAISKAMNEKDAQYE